MLEGIIAVTRFKLFRSPLAPLCLVLFTLYFLPEETLAADECEERICVKARDQTVGMHKCDLNINDSCRIPCWVWLPKEPPKETHAYLLLVYVTRSGTVKPIWSTAMDVSLVTIRAKATISVEAAQAEIRRVLSDDTSPTGHGHFTLGVALKHDASPGIEPDLKLVIIPRRDS